MDWSNWDEVTKGGGSMLVPCFHCHSLVEDFTTSSYRLEAGGPQVGRVCADCSQGVSAEELVKQEEYQLGIVQNADGSSQIDDSLLADDGPTADELAAFANEQQEYELAHMDWDEVMEQPKARQATAQVCICPKHLKDIVYIDSIDGGGDEHDRLDGFYCVNCNSFWREL